MTNVEHYRERVRQHLAYHASLPDDYLRPFAQELAAPEDLPGTIERMLEAFRANRREYERRGTWRAGPGPDPLKFWCATGLLCFGRLEMVDLFLDFVKAIDPANRRGPVFRPFADGFINLLIDLLPLPAPLDPFDHQVGLREWLAENRHRLAWSEAAGRYVFQT